MSFGSIVAFSAKWVSVLAAFLAILFLFLMMQVSQITVPFWDHWDTAYFITTYYDQGAYTGLLHTLTWAHNHTRPAIPRLILVLNAIVTRWSVTSEYIYLYAAMGGTILVHYATVRRLAPARRWSAAEAILFALVVIVFCSPANNNNHWWSFMIILVLANLFCLFALTTIAFDPRGWRANVGAAILCWLAVYSLTNGLLLIATVALLAQFASPRPWRPNLRTAFWAANIALVGWAYFPVPEPAIAHPSLIDLVIFVLAYIGQPVAALIWLPYANMFEPAPGIVLAVICGAVIAAAAILVVVAYREYLRNPPAHFLIFAGFLVFALLSAAATGWGRITFDAYGLRNATSSRYVVFGSYAVLALIYFGYAERTEFLRRITFGASDRLKPAVVLGGLAAAYVVFLVLSANSYAHAVPIYKQARDLNIKLGAGFASDASDTPVDASLFPNQERLRRMRADLLRLRIGPYREERPPR